MKPLTDDQLAEMEALPQHLAKYRCGDGGCVFGSSGGMQTNGGCMHLKIVGGQYGMGARMGLTALMRALRDNARLIAEVRRLRASLDEAIAIRDMGTDAVVKLRMKLDAERAARKEARAEVARRVREAAEPRPAMTASMLLDEVRAELRAVEREDSEEVKHG